MLNEVALTVLELTPVWRLRSVREALALRTVVSLRDTAGVEGWLILEQEPGGEADRLLGNLLQAMALTQTGIQQIELAALSDLVERHAPRWLRLTDEASGDDSADAAAAMLPINRRLSGIECPIFRSPSPGRLVGDARAKSDCWAAWCAWSVNYPR